MTELIHLRGCVQELAANDQNKWITNAGKILDNSYIHPVIAVALTSAALALTTLVANKRAFAPLSFGPSAFIASIALTALSEGALKATNYLTNKEDNKHLKKEYASFYKRSFVRAGVVAATTLAATIAAVALMNVNQAASLASSLPFAGHLSQAVSFTVPNYTRGLTVSAFNVASFASIIFATGLLENKMNDILQ